jgi:uncharacterized protein
MSVAATSLPTPSSPEPSILAPVSTQERITSLDTLRGFALLGILLINIVAMGMNSWAYDDPTVAGGATGINLWVWAVMHVLAEGKMRCLFSLVFGASIILLTSRLEGQKGAADVYYRRFLWLAAFGIVHAYLLWKGDILYTYALCALALYPFRNLSGRTLLTIGAVAMVLSSASAVFDGFGQNLRMIERGRQAVEFARQGKPLTDEQQEEKSAFEKFDKDRHPTAEQLAKINDEWRGSPWSVIKVRARGVWRSHSMAFYHWHRMDYWSMMFIGMALFKMGVLGATRSFRLYWLIVLIGYGIGIPLNSYTAAVCIRTNFDPVVQDWTYATYDLGRLTVALGHLGVVMLLCKAGVLRWLTTSLGAIGQMAFSNYVFHSVVTAFIFTGYGFALYGKLERYQLYYVVFGIWIVQLIVSPIWLRHYRFGPLEWCWRSLTYLKRAPMRLQPSGTVKTAAAQAVA